MKIGEDSEADRPANTINEVSLPLSFCVSRDREAVVLATASASRHVVA